MEDITQKVTQHYSDPELLTRILDAIDKSGIKLDELQPDDLAPVEEFHIGGRAATNYAVSKLSLKPGQRVLDIGCGIGGAARFIATQFDCKLTGVDLSAEYIACANALSSFLGLAEVTDFHTANALDLPFTKYQFDAAISLHAAMNIEDKSTLYQQTAHVLKPGGQFCIFDVMRKNAGALRFPVPWAASDETSFLTTTGQMLSLLSKAGFIIKLVEDRSEMAVSFFEKRLEDAQSYDKTGPTRLGIDLIIRDQIKEKFKNTLVNIQNERIAPVLMVATRSSTPD